MKTWVATNNTTAITARETIGQAVAGLIIARAEGTGYEVIQVATGLSVPSRVYADVKAARDARDALADLADWTQPPTNGHYTAALAVASDALLVEDFDVAVGKAQERWTRLTTMIRKAGKPK